MKLTSVLSFFAPVLIATSNVAAHGFVSSMKVDGKFFRGNALRAKATASAIRQVADFVPIYGAKNGKMTCGAGAKPASLSAEAKPGSTLEFSWLGGDNKSKWPHNVGPLQTYLASCGSQSCDKVDASKAKWFKISEQGKKSNGEWFQADLQRGQAAKVTLPKNLKAGNYLVRHEIIALHLAVAFGKAEFYAGCAQLKVTGSGTGVPTADELVSIPGVYNDNDPGLFTPNLFNPGFQYKFPGPKVSKLAGKDTNNNANNTPAAPSKTSTKSPSSTAAPPKNNLTGDDTETPVKNVADGGKPPSGCRAKRANRLRFKRNAEVNNASSVPFEVRNVHRRRPHSAGRLARGLPLPLVQHTH